MKTTIDAAGRIVVPKAIHQALGLKAGHVLELRAGDGRLEIETALTAMQLKKRGKGVVAVPDEELPPNKSAIRWSACAVDCGRYQCGDCSLRFLAQES